MIELRNIDFSYGTKPVLNDISFKVVRAESVVIMGPSGSGKSTILRLLLGLENPQRGDIVIEGQNIRSLKEKNRRDLRKKIGMVFQEGALFDSLTVGENVGYYLLEHTKMSLDEIDERVREMLGFVDLDADEIIDVLPDQLSGGMKRRVAIGRALLSDNPSIMLFDEPTTGLDPTAIENVLGLIRKVREEKSIATVIVTHQIADAIAIADRFMVIIDGELVFDGNLRELRDSKSPNVENFLAPFRASFDKVNRRDFVRE